jgi:peroxiredoxin
MDLIAPGAVAPAIPGIGFADGPLLLFFYKVTCPVCQMAAPKIQSLERAYPGRIAGVGQDPETKLGDFADRFGMTFPSVSDPAPYPASDAFGIGVVPTAFLIGADSTVQQVVESWDREAYNELSRQLAGPLGSAYVPVSEPGDGLPSFRPG